MLYIKKKTIHSNIKRVWGKFYLSDGSVTHFEMRKGESYFQWGNIDKNLCLTANEVEKITNDWLDKLY